MLAVLVRRITLSLLIVVFAATAAAQDLPRVDPSDVGMSAERLERIDEAFQEYVDEGRLAGAAIVIARRGGVVYDKAFGHRDREAGDRLETDDLFRIASQTKALVSVGIMMLQERGELLISDPVSKYIPEFENTTVAVPGENGSYEVVPADRPITIKHLLTHTSGIGYGYGVAADRWEAAGIQGWYFADRSESIGETIARMGALPIDAQPGEKWIYGYNTDILGVVIEKVSGKTLPAFLTEEILTPLKMHDTFFYVPAEEADRLTVVYSATESGGLERAPDPGRQVGQGAYLEGPRMSFSGGAGLISTAGDYARFLEALRRGGELDGARILSPKTVELMTVDHVQEAGPWDGQGFGLGFSVVEDLGDQSVPGSVGSYGWGGAYHSNYWVDPVEELVVAYMVQLIPARGLDDRAKLEALVYQAIVE